MSAELKQTIREDGMEALGRYYGCYRGIVHSNEDDEFLGRLQVIVPAVTGDEVIEEWAWPKGIYAGKDIGFFAVPNPKDGVWVSFENGDPRFPIWEYGWWAKDQVPSAAKNNGKKPTNQVFQTTSGHRMEFDDKQGEEAIRFVEKNGNKTTMDKDGIIIEDKFGHKIVMKNGFVSVVRNNDKISLGADGGSAEPAVLGDKNEAVLKKLADSIKTIIQAFASASVTPMDGGATFKAALIAATTATLSDVITISATEATQTKSQKVSLD